MVSKAEKKPLEKPPSPSRVVQKASSMKRKKKRVETWETYIYKVLKDVNRRLPVKEKKKKKKNERKEKKSKNEKGNEVEGEGEGEGEEKEEEEEEEEEEAEKETSVEMNISKKAMAIMNSFVTDLFEKLAEEASMLNKSAKRETFTSWPIQKAVRVVLPYELGQCAEIVGITAVHKFAFRTPDAPDIVLPLLL